MVRITVPESGGIDRVIVAPAAMSGVNLSGVITNGPARLHGNLRSHRGRLLRRRGPQRKSAVRFRPPRRLIRT